MYINEIVNGITPVKQEWREQARAHMNNLTMPQGSLGDLLDLAEQIAGIREDLKFSVENKYVITMAGDHGVVEEGVSAFPKEVTPQMVANFVAGGAAINVLSQVAGAQVVVVDMGVDADLADWVNEGQILSKKIGYGTNNITKGPAMSRDEATRCVEAGFAVASRLIQEEGAELLATGDMGIGNTTPSSAILAAMSGMSAEEVTGRGTGVDDEGLARKVEAIQKALDINRPDASDALDVLAKVGGYEIGGIAGVILAAAYHRIPVLVDGFISSAGALIAKGLASDSVDYMIASHKSAESGHVHMWDQLGIEPLLDLGFRLGEGTGAAVAMNLVESSCQIMNRMSTFEQAGVTNKE